MMSVAFFLILLAVLSAAAASGFPAATSSLSCSPRATLVLARLQRREIKQLLLFRLGSRTVGLLLLRVLLLVDEVLRFLLGPPLREVLLPLHILNFYNSTIAVRLLFLFLVLPADVVAVKVIDVLAGFLGRTSCPLLSLRRHRRRHDANIHVGTLRRGHARVRVVLMGMALIHHVRGYLRVRRVVRVVLLRVVLRLREVLELVALRRVALRVLLVVHLLLMVMLHR